jgi:hypothetical protein
MATSAAYSKTRSEHRGAPTSSRPVWEIGRALQPLAWSAQLFHDAPP